MIELQQLQLAVEKEYESSKGSKTAKLRMKAFSHIFQFIQDIYQGDISCLEMGQSRFKVQFLSSSDNQGLSYTQALKDLFTQYNLLKKQDQ